MAADPKLAEAEFLKFEENAAKTIHKKVRHSAHVPFIS